MAMCHEARCEKTAFFQLVLSSLEAIHILQAPE